MNSFETNIINIYGKPGKEWLSHLPDTTQNFAKKWQLSNLKPLDNLSYHYVLSGLRNNQPIILKLGLDIGALQRECTALTVFSGYGAVGVLANSDGALLLEHALPGFSLKSYFPGHDMGAIQVVCDVIKKLHQAPLPQEGLFPNIRNWLIAIDKEWPIPANYLAKARHLRDHLLATMAKPVLLHGDLHHDNILQNGAEWVAIDPHGVVGEPAYEVASFIRNPVPELLREKDAADIITKRIISFAKMLDFDAGRIHDWCFVQAVLSWIWSLEDGSDIEYFRKLVNIIDNLDI